ncbi:UDP-3-O-[3-hydroxymyristoyl] N-acetylglucosamine deacetylase [Candidatus Sumerlaeota bacterium]|nr:UDP-3-O-[3-hydroxymyristoyl] N-acetylglucosamine deacetylase [Candidatus Sumerlaeota bacterium]
MEFQTTIQAPVALEGRGVHSGLECRLTILPAEADYGVRFARTDLPGVPEIPASLDALGEDSGTRQTILRSPDNPQAFVSTIEHVLAVLHALAIDNARIEMTGPEAPIWDGSARELAVRANESGVRVLDGSRRRVFAVRRPLFFEPEDGNGVQYSLWPSRSLTITYFLEYDHPLIGAQAATFRIDPETFVAEIAPARTFCTFEEVEYLRSRGLIQGGEADNAIVIGRDRILNTELLWPNELARHKLLDLLGDLFLLGGPVRGHVVAWRAGHRSNARLLDFLRKELSHND